MDTIAAYHRSRPRFSDVAPPTDAHAPSQHLSALRQLPHSTASLGPAFRSRSLDHSRFSNFDTETRGGLSRTYYASKPGGGGGRAYAPSASQQKAELFRESGKREQKPQVQPRLSQMNSDAYRSNSAERSGVTVVPIRRDFTLPTRRSEWRTAEWKSRSPNISQFEDSKKEGEEFTSFDRAVRYNHQRTVWPPPPRGPLGYGRKTEGIEMAGAPRRVSGNLYYPDSATAEYSSRKSHQTGSDAAYREHFQNGHQQRHHRAHREWHSGAENDNYGTRRNGTEQYQHYGREKEGTAAGRAGYYQQRFREERDMRRMGRGGSGQAEYSNGWGGESAHHYAERGYGRGHFEDDSRMKIGKGPLSSHWGSSHRVPKEYDSPKRYRRVRCCCFNLIWPPWAIVPSEPPRPMYGNGSSQNQRTYERNVPIELRTYDERREPIERDGHAAQMPFDELRRSKEIDDHRRRNVDQFRGQEGTDQRMRHPTEEEGTPGKWGRREREMHAK